MTLPVPLWFIQLVAPLVALVVVLGLHRALQRLLTRLFPRDRGAPVLGRVIRAGQRPVRFALAMATLLAILPEYEFSRNVNELLSRSLGLAFIGGLGWALAAKLQAVFDTYLEQAGANEAAVDRRRRRTKLTVFRRLTTVSVLAVTAGFMLMTIPVVRTVGLSLFASAGVAGIIVGLAARPTIANLIAGIQIAVTQPIRIGDEVIVEGEFGCIEEITATYIVIRVWDERRMVVPLGYFLEKPFQNWTRESTRMLGTVLLYVDYGVPVAELRTALKDILKRTPLWDGCVWNLQVTDLKERCMEVRILVSARDSGAAFDLRCHIREEMIRFIAERHPGAFPRLRAEVPPLSSASSV
ncbi:MAG TPA: mechanosensitive ion channel domain-containing protein [Azospirillum sp.]|nr:mechanosensitive ion channel domain-containing protein [Azospirillum sp.]